MTAVTRPAHAKLNAFLRVLGRREDGYHDIETAILPLELHDDVTVEEADALEVIVTGEGAGALEAAGGDSLTGRAAHAWATTAGVGAPRARITIEKRIPVAAGLGGGSADAAATLVALDELFGTELPAEALLGAAATVGSDVPALVAGGPMFAEGRGERVVPLHALTTHWVVKPFGFAVRAAAAYAWWDDASPRTGPDPGALVAAIEVGDDALFGSAMFDDLEPAVAARHPDVARAVAAFGDAGALGAIMSGSGPTVVALARHLGHADALSVAVPGSFVTSSAPPTPPRTMAAPSGVV
jgi:4-diphosphocytidyl-2-C-methyl-D-erythritol kinase